MLFYGVKKRENEISKSNLEYLFKNSIDFGRWSNNTDEKDKKKEKKNDKRNKK